MEETISVAVRWRPYQQINGEKLDLQKLHETVSKFLAQKFKVSRKLKFRSEIPNIFLEYLNLVQKPLISSKF